MSYNSYFKIPICDSCRNCTAWDNRGGCSVGMDPADLPDNGNCWNYEPRCAFENETEEDEDEN